jgi:nucleotide-binding universal stress UspA family protein
MKLEIVLAAVDGSDTSRRAVVAAAELAAKYDAKLVLVHARRHFGSSHVPEDLVPLQEVEHIRISEADMLESISHRILDDAERSARARGAKRIERVAAIGEPGAEIAREAKARGANLVVMGRRGLGRIGGALLGSVTTRVMQLSETACLTVP